MGRQRGSGVLRGRESGPTRPWSVRTYLIVIVAAAVVAVATASAYGFLWSAGEARERAIDDMSRQATRAAAHAGEGVSIAQQTIAGLTGQPGLRNVFVRPQDCSLTASAGLRVDIVGSDGGVVCSSDPSPRVVAASVHGDSDWLGTALRSPGLVVDWDETDAATGQPAIVMTAPIDKAEPALGAVALFVDVPGVAPTLARDYASSDDVSFTLVDRSTRAVLSTSEAPAGAAQHAPFRMDSTEGDWNGVDGTRRLFHSADVAGSDWRVYAGISRSAVLADARGALMRHLLVGLLALLILVVAAWMLNRRVAGPLRRIIDAVGHAGREPDDTRVAEAGTVELVTLAREFNAMLDIRAGHEAQLLHQATHDSLTGLPNKALLGNQLAEALGAGADGVAVFCIGLDRLDIVTDGFGHDAGDRVVEEVATRLSAALDTDDTLARFGGDEFVVLCTGVVAEQTRAIAERLLRCLDRPFRGPAAGLVVKGAIGVALARTPAASPEQLLREADSAMREARTTGRGWMLFDGALQQRATRHLTVEHELWQALQRRELVVHYQPLLEVDAERIVAVEALVRWDHPERGLVPPLEFIPTAEETGQISEIGRFVLSRACEQTAAWTAAGHPLRVSVNVAVSQLRDPAFPGSSNRSCPRRTWRRSSCASRSPSPRSCARPARGPASWRDSRRWASNSRWTTSAPATRRCRTCTTCPWTSSRSTGRSSAASAAHHATAT
jgi:diguanylate cyclase (GGDEF)-like protein